MTTNKVLKITQKDVTDYIKSRARHDLLISFISNDTHLLVKDIPRWKDSYRVLGYLDSIIRYNDIDKEAFYEQCFFAGRGDLIGRCKFSESTLEKTIKDFFLIRAQLHLGKAFEEMRVDRTILALFVSLKVTQKEFYNDEQKTWVSIVQENLQNRSKKGNLSREESETLEYINSIR